MVTAPADPDEPSLSAGPLSGIVVADFGRVLAAPYCTMLLADLGATVLKVESPTGDDTRRWRPPEVDGLSTYYLSINRNKYSIVLDFDDPHDLLRAQRLAARADVFVENFKPGGLRRFGLDYDAVAKTNPGVIYASITGFGTSSGTALPGYDILVQALSGLMDITGAADTEGFRSGIAIFDVMTGLHAGFGILAALHHRGQTGEGQHVEFNLMSSALSSMVNQTGGYALTRQVPERLGNDHPSIFPYGPFDTADRPIMIAIGNDRQFSRLCGLLGLDDVPTDPQFSTNEQRSKNRETLRPMITARLAHAGADDWFARFNAANLPSAPILDVGAGIEFAERIGLRPIVTFDDGRGQPFRTVRNPIDFSRTPVSYRMRPPALDEHGDEIRRWLDTPSDRG